MFATDELVDPLLFKLNASKNNYERLCFHDNNLSMQIMMIALAQYAVYDFFRNYSDGKIVFTCLSGKIRISWFDISLSPNSAEHRSLERGSTLVLNKNLYRRTKNMLSIPSVFLECIDGPFDVSDKDFFSSV